MVGGNDVNYLVPINVSAETLVALHGPRFDSISRILAKAITGKQAYTDSDMGDLITKLLP